MTETQKCVEIINTGSELILGRVLNTNQQWLCRRLADLGYWVTRQVTVSDSGGDIEQAAREALSRADLVITTGGLGPTTDDLTRERIAELLGRKLREDQEILRAIQEFFAVRNRPMPESNRLQAMVPEGARVLANPNGTAPGLAIEARPNPFRAGASRAWLVLLPGPPRELRPMFDNVVVPLLRREMPVEIPYACRTLRTSGIGESRLQDMIGDRLRGLVEAGLELGYCAQIGRVDVRLSGRGENAERLAREAERIVREQLGASIYGTEEEGLEAVTIRLLIESKQTLAVAESCTGGCLANRLTNVPGASDAFLAGLVTYSNEAKQRLLGVSPEMLAQHGAVSEPVARRMAEGARERMGADYALSVTGIAGPGGGSPQKPVGTAFIGLASARETAVERHFNPYDRETFKEATTQRALELLRRSLTSG